MGSIHRELDINEGAREMDNNKMDINHTSPLDEEMIIKWQRTSLIIAFIFGIIGVLIVGFVFGPAQYKYILLGPGLPMIYLGMSSITNRLSVVKAKGQKGYARGSQAVFMGVLVLTSVIFDIVIVFSPFLDSFFLNEF
jgi:hypothetical protein